MKNKNKIKLLLCITTIVLLQANITTTTSCAYNTEDENEIECLNEIKNVLATDTNKDNSKAIEFIDNCISSYNDITTTTTLDDIYYIPTPNITYNNDIITTTTTTPTTTELTTTTPTTTTTTPELTTTITTNNINDNVLNYNNELPNSVHIDNVKPIVQVGLPTGCEATGLTILLNYMGYNVSKEEIALTYMPREDFTYINGISYGPNYNYIFAGNPTRDKGSFGCYIPCMVNTVENYFNAIGVSQYYNIKNLTGSNLDDLFKYIANGIPVAVITTNNLITPTTGCAWYLNDNSGNTITWQKGHHCMIITGYDYNKNTITVSESAYWTEQTYNMDKFREIYNLKGKNAMVITTK